VIGCGSDIKASPKAPDSAFRSTVVGLRPRGNARCALSRLDDFFSLARGLGPEWGPLALPIFLLSWRIRYLWRDKGARGWALPLDGWVLGLSLASGIFFPIYHYWFDNHWHLPPPFSQGDIGILIAEVPGDTDRQLQSAYANAIRAITAKTPELEGIVKVRLITRSLSPDPEEQHVEATRIGRRLHASFVLRAFSIGNVQQVWVTIIEQPVFSKNEGLMGTFAATELADVDKLPLPREVLLLARCIRALSLYRRRSYNDATSELQEILASKELPSVAPGRWALNSLLGSSLEGAGHPDKAIEPLKRGTDLNPSFAEGHNNLGLVLLQSGDAAAARSEFAEAARLKPRYAEAHYNLALALQQMGKEAESRAEFEKAFEISPDLRNAPRP